ncbi:XRE family transcriptional regulator [Streptomyces sp. DT171]|uniref:XRE family transcriptional regulator n=1 Tax=Streptomyces sp. DT171 TaxID=3416524 RepID=UPI003CEAF433
MYDRKALRAAAAVRGDAHFEQVATRLGVARATAWRLWTGKGAPSARTAAAIHREYGLGTGELIHQAAA